MLYQSIGAIGLAAAIAVSPAQACSLPSAAAPHDAFKEVIARFALRELDLRETYSLDLADFQASVPPSATVAELSEDGANDQRYSECLNQLIRTLAHVESGTREVLIHTLWITGSADWDVILEGQILPFNLVFSNASLPKLTLDHIRSERDVVLHHVKIHGSLFIGNSHLNLFTSRNSNFDSARISVSRFDSEILFQQIDLPGPFRFHGNKIAAPFRIEDSQLADLRILQNYMDELGLYGSQLGRASFYSNELTKFELHSIVVSDDIYIYENTFHDTVDLTNVFSSERFVFNSNDIQSQGHLKVGSGAKPGPTSAIEIANNVIEGEAHIELDMPALEKLLNAQTATAEAAQPMLVSFERSIFEDAVFIGKTRPGATLQPDSSGHGRPAGSGDLHPEFATEYCFRGDGTKEKLQVDLSYARAERVKWGLPLGDCRFRWVGKDFRFRTFQIANKGANGQGLGPENTTPSGAELIWRFQLHGPEPSALLAMSENADEGGRFSDARQLLYEAKEMHYKSNCRDPTLSCFGEYAMFSYLWLSGFGVKPERALKGLVAVWLFFFVVYYLYYARSRSDAECDVVYAVPRRLVPLVRFFASRLGWDAAKFGVITDYGERPPGFYYYSQRQPPADFAIATFSLDATLPVLNLHLYDSYYPARTWALVCTYAQHVFGWVLVTSLITSVAVL